MRSVSLSTTLTNEDIHAQPLTLGQTPAGLSTPDRWVCLRETGNLILSIDLYLQQGEAHCFEAAEAWVDFVVIGIGERLYLIHTKTQKIIEHHLESYFAGIYHFESALYATSAERLFKVGPEGQFQWVSEVLGIDGVLIDEINPITVIGKGEWDPPGGWRPFALCAHTGKLVGQ